MISTYRKYLHDKKILANPEAVATVERIYAQYIAAQNSKKKFLATLAGTLRKEESVLKGMTLEDSREFQKALTKLLSNDYRACRFGRGYRQGNPKYGSYLPLRFAKTVSIYIYPRYNR